MSVAPYVGAWIETSGHSVILTSDTVAPYVGAWIETLYATLAETVEKVAPYVGAWIETAAPLSIGSTFKSHPTWVRGLKHEFGACEEQAAESHPTWVRGLKQGAAEHRFVR